MVDGSGYSLINSIKEPEDTPIDGNAESLATPNHSSAFALHHSPENTQSSPAKASSLGGMRHARKSGEPTSLPKISGIFTDELSLSADLCSLGKYTTASPTTEGLPIPKIFKPKESKKQGEHECGSDVDELNLEDFVANVSPNVVGLSRRRLIRSYDGCEAQPKVEMKASKNREALISGSLVFDDAIVGLPGERYKPRPSRSRSARVIEQEPIDYSIRPEKAAKLRAKRDKAFGESVVRVVPSSPEKLETICAMGFSPSRARKALEEASGSFDGAIEWLCDQPANRTRGGGLRTACKERRLRNNSDELLVNGIADTNETTDKASVRYSSEEREPPNNEAQVVTSQLRKLPKANPRGLLHVEIPATVDSSAMAIQIPRKINAESEFELNSEGLNTDSTKATISRGNRMGSVQPQNNQVQLIEEDKQVQHQPKRRKTTQFEGMRKTLSRVDQSSAEPPKEKRGRGRPRLRPKPSEPTVDACKDADVTHNFFQLQQSTSTGGLQNNGDNKACTGPLSKDKITFDVTAEVPKLINTPPESPEKRSSSILKPTVSTISGIQTSPIAKEASDRAHSPLNKGKVPLRIGLSKRARITPLLRTMKK